MAFVVGTTSNGAPDGANVTVDLTVLGLQQDDAVYVSVGVTDSTTGAAMVSSGWTEVVAAAPDTGSSMRAATYRKIMGASPDTSVEVTGSGNAADSASVAVAALRGVDTTTPEDATATTTSGNSTNPDCPSITTVTNNAWVLAFAHGRSLDASITAPTGYGNLATNATNNANDDATSAVATKEVLVVGAEDPPSYTNWVTGQWITHSVAVRTKSVVRSFAVMVGV